MPMKWQCTINMVRGRKKTCSSFRESSGKCLLPCQSCKHGYTFFPQTRKKGETKRVEIGHLKNGNVSRLSRVSLANEAGLVVSRIPSNGTRLGNKLMNIHVSAQSSIEFTIETEQAELERSQEALNVKLF